jgi:hypothetical protein
MTVRFHGWCSRLPRRAIVVCRADGTVELTPNHTEIVPRQPVDRARAVENAKSAFPTSSLHAHRTRAHTLHKASLILHLDEKDKGRKMAPYNLRRLTRPIALVASLR